MLDLMLEGREAGVEEESGESRTNVPSLLLLWVQSCSSKYDLKQNIITPVLSSPGSQAYLKVS